MRERIELWQAKWDEQSKSNKIAITLLLIGLIGYGFYIYIDEFWQENSGYKKELKIVQRKIHKASPRYLKRKIALLKKKIANLQTTFLKKRQEGLLLQTELDKMRFKFLNDKNLVVLLEDILKDSLRYNVTLSSIVLEPSKQKVAGKIVVAKKMVLDGKSSFLDLEHLLRGIEAHPMLLNVIKEEMERNETFPTFHVVIDLYGVEL